MVKRIVLFAIFGVIVLFAFNRAQALQKDKALDIAMSQAIGRYNSGEHSDIDLAKVADSFSWDTLYIFPPYTSHEEIDRALGFFWFESRFTRIETNENLSLLVFTRKGKVVAYFDYYYFSRVEYGKSYQIDDAHFFLDENQYMVWVPSH